MSIVMDVPCYLRKYDIRFDSIALEVPTANELELYLDPGGVWPINRRP